MKFLREIFKNNLPKKLLFYVRILINLFTMLTITKHIILTVLWELPGFVCFLTIIDSKTSLKIYVFKVMQTQSFLYTV